MDLSNKKAKDLEKDYKVIIEQAKRGFEQNLRDAAHSLKEAKELNNKFNLNFILREELNNLGFSFTENEWDNSYNKC